MSDRTAAIAAARLDRPIQVRVIMFASLNGPDPSKSGPITTDILSTGFSRFRDVLIPIHGR